MADLTTYEFYKNNYHGDKVSIDDFPKWLAKASFDVDYLTCGNITEESLEEFSDNVQIAVCAIVDFLFSMDELQSRASSGASEVNIKSITSGSESITYNTVSTAYEKALSDPAEKRRLEYEEIKPYLSNTGLLYAGL